MTDKARDRVRAHPLHPGRIGDYADWRSRAAAYFEALAAGGTRAVIAAVAVSCQTSQREIRRWIRESRGGRRYHATAVELLRAHLLS